MDFRAGNGTRTRDINLGKVALYQLSYSRISKFLEQIFRTNFFNRTRDINPDLSGLRSTNLPAGRQAELFPHFKIFRTNFTAQI